MRFFKKAISISLAFVIAFGAVFLNEVYADTSCERILRQNITYKYDIDGDGDLDCIRIYTSGGDLKIKVNKCVRTLIVDYSPYEYHFECSAKIYDFNKNDKSKEIVFEWVGPSDGQIRILKFKNNNCKVNRTFQGNIGGEIKSYNPKTGVISLQESYRGIFSKFEKAIGTFVCYPKVTVKGYSVVNQKTASTSLFVRQNRYIAARSLTAYTSTNGRKKAFTISKGSTVHIYSLYQSGNNRYIKVKNKYGKYGYVKAGSRLLFMADSCLWMQ